MKMIVWQGDKNDLGYLDKPGTRLLLRLFSFQMLVWLTLKIVH